MREWFVQTVDAETGEPAYIGCVRGEDIEQAIQEAIRLGRARANGRPVRVTHASEVTEAAHSWFLDQLAAHVA